MMIERLKTQFARALRGPMTAAEKAAFGGTFYTSVDGGPWMPSRNTVMLAYLDDLLSTYFNNGSPPAAFYIAPFTNDVEPTSALTAATFAGTQSEYTGYTETTRQEWVINGAAASQKVSNSAAPAEFTIGATATTVRGAALIAAASGKGDTTGVLIAAARFGVAQPMNPGSTLKIKYELMAAPAA